MPIFTARSAVNADVTWSTLEDRLDPVVKVALVHAVSVTPHEIGILVR